RFALQLTAGELQGDLRAGGRRGGRQPKGEQRHQVAGLAEVGREGRFALEAGTPEGLAGQVGQLLEDVRKSLPYLGRLLGSDLADDGLDLAPELLRRHLD